MELITLEDRPRLNIPEIDSRHEGLIELVDGLHVALLGGSRSGGSGLACYECIRQPYHQTAPL